jgi:hypothetical protein
MKKAALIRATVCFLVLLSFVGACLFQHSARAQGHIDQESQAQARAGNAGGAQAHNSTQGKSKHDKGKIKPMICNDCDPGGDGGGGGGGGYTGDGHIWCDGWDRQGDCAFNHVDAASSAEFVRKLGNNGYDFQCFLTWFPAEVNDTTPGRFPIRDGNVGLISTSPLLGQVALHRWSTRKGFYYSIYYTEHGNDYVYGGVAGYVWPAGDNRGFPLFQFYSDEYGHYYTNYPNEINCQPHVYWDFQGEMARVNFPAPFSQAFRNCPSFTSFAPPCDPFVRLRCEARGSFIITGTCSCFDGLP